MSEPAGPGPTDHDPDGPEQTVDDTDAGWGEPHARVGDAHEQWLLAQRPPHWD
jgi:hypothetical protein